MITLVHYCAFSEFIAKIANIFTCLIVELYKIIVVSL